MKKTCLCLKVNTIDEGVARSQKYAKGICLAVIILQPGTGDVQLEGGIKLREGEPAIGDHFRQSEISCRNGEVHFRPIGGGLYPVLILILVGAHQEGKAGIEEEIPFIPPVDHCIDPGAIGKTEHPFVIDTDGAEVDGITESQIGYTQIQKEAKPRSGGISQSEHEPLVLRPYVDCSAASTVP